MDQLAILQLDTNFPRIAGDICCRETFSSNVNIIKIKNASVSQIISKNPEEQHFINFKNLNSVGKNSSKYKSSPQLELVSLLIG